MKILAVIFNIVLIGFTCLVLVTDGPPQGAAYVVLTLLTLLIPLFTAVVLFSSSMGSMMKTVMIIVNIVLLGLSCWAIMSQYPHPGEEGVIAFTVILVLTPILNLLSLFRKFRKVQETRDANLSGGQNV